MQTGSPHVTYQSSAPVPASPSRFPDPALVAALIPQARLVARIATKADRMPSSSSCLQKGDHRSKDSLGRFFGQEMSAIEKLPADARHKGRNTSGLPPARGGSNVRA